MRFKKGDEVIVCFPDTATDGRIEEIVREEAIVFLPWKKKKVRVPLNILRFPPTGGPYYFDEIKEDKFLNEHRTD